MTYSALTAPFAALLVPAAARAENGGTQGHNFQLFGGAQDSLDPQNETNEIILFNTTPTVVSGASRDINPGTRIEMLTNQVQVKYFFVDCTCGSGSPRVQLGIDRDGDGKFDGNAFGYLGDKPFGGACLPGVWLFEDMTNAVAKWDISQLGSPQTINWAGMVAFIQTLYPNHKVVNGVLADDSCGFFAGACGRVYFDNVVIGNQTINDHSDTARR